MAHKHKDRNWKWPKSIQILKISDLGVSNLIKPHQTSCGMAPFVPGFDHFAFANGIGTRKPCNPCSYMQPESGLAAQE